MIRVACGARRVYYFLIAPTPQEITNLPTIVVLAAQHLPPKRYYTLEIAITDRSTLGT